MQHRDKHAPLKFSLKSDIDIKFKMSIMGFRIVYAVVVLFSIIALCFFYFILFLPPSTLLETVSFKVMK